MDGRWASMRGCKCDDREELRLPGRGWQGRDSTSQGLSASRWRELAWNEADVVLADGTVSISSNVSCIYGSRSFNNLRNPRLLSGFQFFSGWLDKDMSIIKTWKSNLCIEHYPSSFLIWVEARTSSLFLKILQVFTNLKKFQISISAPLTSS